MDYEEILYNHFLNEEIAKRDLVSMSLGSGKIANSNGHYVDSSRKWIKIDDLSLSGAMDEIAKAKAMIPKNAINMELQIDVEEGNGVFEGDRSLYVSWVELSLASEDKCKSLAKCWTNESLWKLRNQPNGKDGRAAAKLYKQLTGGEYEQEKLQ